MPEADSPPARGPGETPGAAVRTTAAPVEIVYAEEPRRVTLVRFANLLLRRRRLLVWSPAILAILAVTISLIPHRTYTSDAAFMPQADQTNVSQLSGLAAQFGFSIPATSTGESPDFYLGLLDSRELRDKTILHTYRIGGDQGQAVRTGTLIDFLGAEGDTDAEKLEDARDKLDEVVDASVQAAAGLVQLSVRARWPELARQVAARMVDLVNEFNLQTRQSQAAAERAFVEERLAHAGQDLQAAEDSMARFLERNRRGYDTSPDLRFEYDRLQRRVSLRQDVYTTLAESYEKARIDEVRNTPVITVVDPADEPAQADSRHLVLRALLGALLGVLLAVAAAVAGEFARNARMEEPDDYARFLRLRAEAGRDLKRLWRRLRRQPPP